MKYHIVTFGCQMNLSDSERIASVLEKTGKETSNISEADLVVVNMCSVRQSAVDRVYGILSKLKKSGLGPKTILTGCVLKKDRNKFAEIFDYVLDIVDFEREANKFFRGEGAPQRRSPRRKNLICRALAKNSLPSGYVPIMTGCNNFCSYCVVPYTRGREVSRPVGEILKEVKKSVKNGAKEIWLLGQNVNSYKGEVSFPKLLKLANDIPGKFELNFLTSHPKDFSDELIETMAKCKKLSKRLNLPIQSGDNEILKKMNRPYTVAQYKNLVKKIRKTIPDILLSTDVIVGFPGETKKQFNNTVKTLKEIKFGVAFINKYSPRAGTAASKMEDNVSWEEKKRREKVLIKLVNEKYRYAKK